MTTLPIYEFRREIIASVENGFHLVITAPTGSGKSTQVPQMLLDAGCCSGRILILQPRRLAARMLAARVAEERGCELGGEIGFQTRFETAVSDTTRACFITEGILPRMLLSNRTLEEVSVIVFDEFHERNLATDVGLAMAVDLATSRRPDLRLVVMSATIEAEPVAAYLGNARMVACPGRQYPIDVRYTSVPKNVPVWNSAANAVRSLVERKEPGDVLVFMPGAYEIRKTVEAIHANVRGEPLTVLPLYGDLPSTRQHAVMERLPHRKVIVATNIAETSLTIPGVRHVIDSGLARINRYDPVRGFNTLFVEPISRDAADQRSGRAGREAAGICIRLWSNVQHTCRADHTTPEIGRVDLTETLLQLRTLGFDDTASVPWFELPDDNALRHARELLFMLGALTSRGKMTDRGVQLCGFPMHPRLGALLLEAGSRKAARLASFAAAVLSERPVVTGRYDVPEEALRQEVLSDIYGVYCLCEKVRKSGYDSAVCTRYGVNVSAVRAVYRTQALYLRYCKRAGLPVHDGEDATVALCRALLSAYPDHLCVRTDRGTHRCRMRGNRTGELDKASIVRKAPLLIAAELREVKTPKGQVKTILSLATEVPELWLHEDFPDAWEITSALEWNQSTASVEQRTGMTCCGVVVSEETAIDLSDTEEAAVLLAGMIQKKNLTLEGWDRTVDGWINRVRWVAEQFPEAQLPLFNESERRRVIELLCRGERRYAAVRKKPVAPVLYEMVTDDQRRFVDLMAPESVALPSGRKMKITYTPGAPPRGRARIQELYKLKESPRVANGKATVLIEILAPNNRPVQITDDLARFWEEHYPALKKTLSRRYPKHEWK